MPSPNPALEKAFRKIFRTVGVILVIPVSLVAYLKFSEMRFKKMSWNVRIFRK